MLKDVQEKRKITCCLFKRKKKEMVQIFLISE